MDDSDKDEKPKVEDLSVKSEEAQPAAAEGEEASAKEAEKPIEESEKPVSTFFTLLSCWVVLVDSACSWKRPNKIILRDQSCFPPEEECALRGEKRIYSIGFQAEKPTETAEENPSSEDKPADKPAESTETKEGEAPTSSTAEAEKPKEEPMEVEADTKPEVKEEAKEETEKKPEDKEDEEKEKEKEGEEKEKDEKEVCGIIILLWNHNDLFSLCQYQTFATLIQHLPSGWSDLRAMDAWH